MLHKSNFTYSEFIDYIEKCPNVSGANSSQETGDRSKKFTGTRSFDEAIKLARYGWDAGIEELREVMEQISTQGVTGIEYDLHGSFVDVGRYNTGEPDCMINFIDMEYPDMDQLTVYIPLTYSCSVSQDRALSVLKKQLEYIIKLMTKYEIRIIGYFYSNQVGDNDDFVEITIKDFKQNIVLNSFAFAFHPSFFRRLWFKYIESKDYHDIFGYGRNQEGVVDEVLSKEKQQSDFLICETLDDYNGVPDINDKFFTKYNKYGKSIS